MKWLDRISYLPLIIAALFLGSAPFSPEPHLWEKLKMLLDGALVKPIDIFDFVFHGTAPVLLAVKYIRDVKKKMSQ
jgi:hypothetical protein